MKQSASTLITLLLAVCVALWAASPVLAVPQEASGGADEQESDQKEESGKKDKADKKSKKKKKDKGDEEDEEEKGPLSSSTFSGLKLRGIGPALTSGRVGDLAMDPTNPKRYFVAVSSGNVWRTENAGTTFEPVFDSYGSYSIGCITMDPNNPLVLWLGTGENNSQRSVAYGDGVYKSVDGGRSWKNVGLKESEHIGMIVVDPRDSNMVYVAAQGPLWSSGGDRGLYKTMDGGETWERILEIDEHTGVNEVHLDPRNPDVLYASSYQRRRHVWVLLNGGPGSGIHKSTDGGQTWTELTNGIPGVDKGRIGMDISPANPDILYAVIEAQDDKGGFFRSTNAGASWEKRSDYNASSPQYYHEIIADPRDPDRVYSLDTLLKVTENGGKSFDNVPIRYKHVDDHALWIDPEDTDHLLNGNDGGVYESWDRGENWQFKGNLPITQFYKITVDQDFPFYSVYGGTQDNNTLGTYTRNTTNNGIHNTDWFITLGGDGFEPQVDPENPDIIYSQYQYGGLARHDRKSGEVQDIQPAAQPGEALKWNWSSALIISPHSNTRLYYGAQKLFRSDDRGDSWQPVSGDLTRQIDRNELEVMDRIWSVDAVSKNRSTSFYGTIVSLSESPLEEGLLYAGTDDGLIQVTEDGGENWTRHESFGDVPEATYVSQLITSVHQVDTAYAAFDNHKKGDFKPYVMKTTDRGATWTDISGDLPERGTVYSVAEDHENPDLLFAGTEFGVFFTVDGGTRWIRLKGGIPTIACRDLDIQRRENDLAVGTFGRGIYILDDYAPLRTVSDDLLEQEAHLFGVKDPWLFVESSPLGGRGAGSQGASFYFADNPAYGAVFTYYLKDGYKTLREERREKEKEIQEDDGDNPYPTWDELRAEDREEKPVLVFTIRDDRDRVVRRVTGSVDKGLHRVAWDLRYPAPHPARKTPWSSPYPWASPPQGPLVVPGTFQVSMALRARGETRELGEAQSFEVRYLEHTTLPASDRAAARTFQAQTAELRRAVMGAGRMLDFAEDRLAHIRRALQDTPAAPMDLTDRVDELDSRVADLRMILNGDRTISRRSEPTPQGLSGRLSRITWGWDSTSAPTGTHRESYRIAAEAFGDFLPQLQELVEKNLKALEDELERHGAPYTPGRMPEWKP
jgi:photosystem II stability/assembly factor-like uncharacterized protein